MTIGANDVSDTHEGTQQDFDLSSMTVDDLQEERTDVDATVDQQVQPQEVQQQTQDSAKRQTQQRPGTDEQGNLVAPDGTVVARSGAERRHYERARNMEAHVRNVEAELARVNEQLAESRASFQQFQSSGLTPEQATNGIQWVARFHKDPVETVKQLLTGLESQGINVRQQLFPDGGAVDMAAIQQMLDQRLAPLTQATQQRAAEQQAVVAARRAYDEFVARHEHANVHEDQIAAIMQKTGSDAPSAYWRLNAWAARNGLDFSKPLGPQMQTQSRQGGTTPPRGGGNAPVQSTAKAVSGSSGWNEIISAAMSDGM